MIETIESMFHGIMESNDETYMMEQAMKLIVVLLQELKEERKQWLLDITDSFEKKKMIALFSKMNNNFNTFLDNYQGILEEEVQNLDKQLDKAGQNRIKLEAKRQELSDKISKLKTDNQELLLDELKLLKQKELVDYYQAQQKELNEEEKRVLGEDGKALAHIKEKQEEHQKQIDTMKKEVEYKKDILNIFNQLYVRETEDHMVSNITEIQQKLEYQQKFMQDDMDVYIKIKNTLENLKENIENYTKAVIEEENIQKSYVKYRKNWGEESDFMIKMSEFNMESEEKLHSYITELQRKITTDLQAYDEILSSIVEQNEQMKDSIEYRNGKKR